MKNNKFEFTFINTFDHPTSTATYYCSSVNKCPQRCSPSRHDFTRAGLIATAHWTTYSFLRKLCHTNAGLSWIFSTNAPQYS